MADGRQLCESLECRVRNSIKCATACLFIWAAPKCPDPLEMHEHAYNMNVPGTTANSPNAAANGFD
jgi:hypothetical protein